MILNITEKEYEKFNKINTSKYNSNNKKSDIKYTVPVNQLQEGDKLYVYPNCKIKKLPLRKYLKDKNIIQVHKPEEANCLIVPENLISISTGYWSSSKLTVRKKYLIPAGKYYYNHDKRVLVYSHNEDRYHSYNEMLNFVFNVYFKRNIHDLDKVRIKNNLYDKINTFNIVYELNTAHSKINTTHFATQLIKDDVILINEDDLQQVVYNWEVDNEVRESTEDYNWEGIQSLIESKDGYNLGIQMIQKMNVEPILSKLIAYYYSSKSFWESRELIYKNIFSRNPLLISFIGKWRYPLNNQYNIINLINNCKTNNINLNLNDFKLFDIEVFENIASNGDVIYSVHL